MTIWGVPGRRQKRVVSKCANPLDLLFLLLPPLEQVERLPGGLRWARGWSLVVVIVVQQIVIGCSIIVVGGIVVRGVVVEEIVGRAGHSFSPAQVRQEAPGEGGALQTLCQNHILSHLPHIAKRWNICIFRPHCNCMPFAVCIKHTNPFSWVIDRKQTPLPLFNQKQQVQLICQFIILFIIHYLSFSLPNSSSGSETMVKNITTEHYRLHHTKLLPSLLEFLLGL